MWNVQSRLKQASLCDAAIWILNFDVQNKSQRNLNYILFFSSMMSFWNVLVFSFLYFQYFILCNFYVPLITFARMQEELKAPLSIFITYCSNASLLKSKFLLRVSALAFKLSIVASMTAYRNYNSSQLHHLSCFISLIFISIVFLVVSGNFYNML